MEYISASVNDFDNWTVSRLKLAIVEAKKKNQKTLPVMINSPGGSVYHLLQMIDELDASGLNIVTIVNGIAMSAGAILFSVGKKRYLSKNSTVMIHDASYFAMGKHSDVTSLVTHVDDVEGRLYEMMNSQSGQPEGYYQNLVQKNNGADLYLNSDQALEHGLATDIGIPSMYEVLNFRPENNTTQKVYSEYEKVQLLMQYVPNADLNKENGLEGESSPANNLTNFREDSPVDLKTILASLNDEQKKPIVALQSALDNAKTELNNFSTRLTEKEQEITTITGSYEKKLTDLVAEQDNEFIDRLLANHQLTRVEAEKEKEALAELSDKPKAKASYKERLAKSAKLVEGEIPNNGEGQADLSSLTSEDATIKAVKDFCKKNNITFDENSSSSVRSAFKAYSKSLDK